MVPDTPQTGINGMTVGMTVSLISLLLALGCFACIRAKDNPDFYLNHDFNRNYSFYGTSYKCIL